MKHLTFWSLVVCLGLYPVSIVFAERPMSVDDANVLCDLMTVGHLDAIAARDISHPGRFVAALLYPHSELLVTSAQYGVPLALFALGIWFVYRLVNIARFADFLIAVEAEMVKVSWPSRSELIRSSTVVIVTIFGLAFVLAMYDFFWNWLLNSLLKIKG